MSFRNTKWVLAVVLIVAHLLFNIVMFVMVETSPDGEAVMGYGILATIVDFPSSLAANALEGLVWEKEMLWHSDDSSFRRFDRRFGFDRCNVGLFTVYVPIGTIHWGILGFLLQLAWRKLRQKRKTSEQSPRTYSSKAADGLTGNAQE